MTESGMTNKNMESKQAANILIKMLESYPLSEEEKEAVSAAIGILSWTMLSDSRMKAQRVKRKKRLSH